MKYRLDCPSIGMKQMYNFKTRQWQQLQSLNTKRNSTLKLNNYMLIVGLIGETVLQIYIMIMRC